MNSRLLFPLALAAGLLTGLPDVFAAGSHADGHRHGFDFGRPAKASEAKRTVTVVMRDNLYEPEAIVVQAGETVRFVVENEGSLVHEFNIGTATMHARSEEHTSELQSLI